MSQSDGEPAWQSKTYNASKDKKTLDWNKQGSNIRDQFKSSSLPDGLISCQYSLLLKTFYMKDISNRTRDRHDDDPGVCLGEER